MALTGIVLIGFVFVHMAGNLQILAGQEQINNYAYNLQNLPWFILWGSRIFLFVCVFLHALTAYLLIKENRAARPVPNEVEKTKRAGWSSLRMGFTGSIIAWLSLFSTFFISRYDLFFPNTVNSKLQKVARRFRNFTMFIKWFMAGFRVELVSISYVLSMFLLCRHLAHGVSSVFSVSGDFVPKHGERNSTSHRKLMLG